MLSQHQNQIEAHLHIMHNTPLTYMRPHLVRKIEHLAEPYSWMPREATSFITLSEDVQVNPIDFLISSFILCSLLGELFL